jgi:hypothetical protein
MHTTPRLSLLLLFIGLAFAAPLRAQSEAETALPAIDASLTTVLVRGYWKEGAAKGSYRVVEITEGSEEIRRRVIVQWLSETSESEASVVASREIGPLAGNVWSTSDPDLVLVKGHWYLTVCTTSQPMGQPDGTLRVGLGAPGKLGPVIRR